MSAVPRPLPCYPCPHASACCRYGTTVTGEEARAITTEHGPDQVFLGDDGEWRTQVRNGYCVMLVENVCTIHDKPYYPEVCRCFPWTDAETGGPYLYDQSICPELKRAESREPGAGTA